MPKEVQLWRIEPNDQVREVPSCALNLEARIETWLAANISMLDPDLLVIGKQVATEFGGIIDLLCIDREGGLVIVELKRDRTPRVITAQVLDYASWVNDLSAEQIATIAAAYLKDKTLGDAFSAQFGSDLPDAINSEHRMIIVGSVIDEASERIIQYLSDVHGVNINAATFQYYKEPDGTERIARAFLIAPSKVDQRSQTRGNSKRAPNLTMEQLQAIAEEKGVEDLYAHAVARLEDSYIPHATKSSLSFYDDTVDGRLVTLRLLPSESRAESGLRFQLLSLRVCANRGITEDRLRSVLPKKLTAWRSSHVTGPDGAGVEGDLASIEEIDRLADAIGDPR